MVHVKCFKPSTIMIVAVWIALVHMHIEVMCWYYYKITNSREGGPILAD